LTISLVKIEINFPLLITLAYVLLYSSCKASLREVFLYSEIVENPVAKIMAIKMLTISIAPFPLESVGKNIPKIVITILTPKAAINTLIQISFKDSKNI